MAGRTHNDSWEQTDFQPGDIILAYTDGFHRIVEVSDTQVAYIQVANSNGKPINATKVNTCHKAWCMIVDAAFIEEEYKKFHEKWDNITRLRAIHNV